MNKIKNFELVKIERPYNKSIRPKYFYSIKLEGIEEDLLFETEEQVKEELVGKTISYSLNKESYLVENFQID